MIITGKMIYKVVSIFATICIGIVFILKNLYVVEIPVLTIIMLLAVCIINLIISFTLDKKANSDCLKNK